MTMYTPEQPMTELEYLRRVRDAALRFVTMTERDNGQDILEAYHDSQGFADHEPLADGPEVIKANLAALADLLAWTMIPRPEDRPDLGRDPEPPTDYDDDFGPEK